MRKKPILLLAVGAATAAALIWMNPLDLPMGGQPAQSADASMGANDAPLETEAPSKDQKVARLPVEGVEVFPSSFVLTVQASGRAEAVRRVELAPRVGERVTTVHVSEGDPVRKGQVLAELDPRPFEIALAEARAAQSNARAEADIRLLSDNDATEAKRAMVADRSGLTAAEQDVARAELNLESTRLVAPFDGHVSAVAAERGALAASNEPLFTLVDLSRVRVPAEVLESSFGGLTTGSTATVRFPALPGRRFPGRVRALSPEIDPERGTGIAYIDIDNPDELIKPGMFAEVEIASAVYEDRMSVPRSAVLERERRLLVFKAVEGRAEWQYVDTGMETDERIEITSGLAPGDTVLVEGHLTLAHAAPIRVRLRDATP